MAPHKQAGHMTCTRPQAESQNPLAPWASSTHDPERRARLFDVEFGNGAWATSSRPHPLEPEQGQLLGSRGRVPVGDPAPAGALP